MVFMLSMYQNDERQRRQTNPVQNDPVQNNPVQTNSAESQS